MHSTWNSFLLMLKPINFHAAVTSHMQRILLLFPVFLILLSCSKDKKTSEEFYFRFKANGVQKEYLLTGSFFYSEKNCLLAARQDSLTNNNTIAIDLESTVKIKADTTYIEAQALPAPVPYYPRFYIRLSDNYPAYNYSSWISTPAGANIYPCTITILEIDANHVKGKVSGKVANEAENAFITITDGEFNVKR
jgi:hypothetical protein